MLLCYFRISFFWDQPGWHLRLSQLQQKDLFLDDGVFLFDMAARNLLRYSVSTFVSLICLSLPTSSWWKATIAICQLFAWLGSPYQRCLYGGGMGQWASSRVLQLMWPQSHGCLSPVFAPMSWGNCVAVGWTRVGWEDVEVSCTYFSSKAWLHK